MRGHIRQRGKVWSYVIELGNQKTQRCLDCNKRHWVERRPYEKCERCGGELRDRVERRQPQPLTYLSTHILGVNAGPKSRPASRSQRGRPAPASRGRIGRLN